MKREAGPSRRHSPFSAPGLSLVLLAIEVAVAVAVSATEKTEATIPVEAIWRGAVGNAVDKATSLGRARKGDNVEEACCRNDIKLRGCVKG